MRLGLLKILLGLALCSVFASAGPVVWILSGVTFADGGTASGSFVYNADTNTYSSINVTTTTGSARSGATYHFQNGGGANALGMVTVVAADLTGTPDLALGFSSSLTNAGGTRTLTGNFEATCQNAGCSSQVGPLRNVTAGSIQGAAAPPPAVPLPPTVILILTGFGLIGLDQARRKFARFHRGTAPIL
jgi:hypothetical protein